MVPAYGAWSQSPTSTPAALREAQRLPQPSSSYHDSKDKPKKPRHRHSAYQLAALNELYERDEHPPLEDRTSLAERLDMEVKTVNAWFQNKRASTKKRSNKAGSTSTSISTSPSANSRENNAHCELPPISTLLASVAPPNSHPSALRSAHFEYDELSEDEYSDRLPQLVQHQQSNFYAGNPQHRHLFDTETSMLRKGRSRPSAAQTEELRKLYDANPHPSKEAREELGLRIGMRYQSVTNWFQNQRSIAKKRKEEDVPIVLSTLSASSSRGHGHPFSSFPPSSSVAHPSLGVPPVKGHPSLPSLPLPPRARRSPSAASFMDSRASSPRPVPYSAAITERASSVSSRSRRTRPEPYQLEALKRLFQRTATPSIEERGALALEINMDVGKVTNWFRNLRQTARKRSKQVSGSDEDDDMSNYNDISRNVSRESSPISMGPSEDYMATVPHEALRTKRHADDSRNRMYTHASNSRSSDMASEEDFQEAVTPSPVSSPYPAVPVSAPFAQKLVDFAPHVRRDISVAVGALTFAEVERAPGVTIEDAMLLLDFSNSFVR